MSVLIRFPTSSGSFLRSLFECDKIQCDAKLWPHHKWQNFRIIRVKILRTLTIIWSLNGPFSFIHMNMEYACTPFSFETRLHTCKILDILQHRKTHPFPNFEFHLQAYLLRYFIGHFCLSIGNKISNVLSIDYFSSKCMVLLEYSLSLHSTCITKKFSLS